MGDPRVENSAAEAVLQFGLAKEPFEISQAGARQLFAIMLSCPPPLLQMSLEQASPFVRLVNIVRRSVYVPSRVDGLPQQVFPVIPSLYEREIKLTNAIRFRRFPTSPLEPFNGSKY